MDEPTNVEDNHVKNTIIAEGWKYLGTTDVEVWGKDKNRIQYCPKTKKITKQYTSETVV